MTEEEAKPISTPEMLAMRGPAFTIAKQSIVLRSEAEDLFRKAHQKLADAKEYETAARRLAGSE